MSRRRSWILPPGITPEPTVIPEPTPSPTPTLLSDEAEILTFSITDMSGTPTINSLEATIDVDTTATDLSGLIVTFTVSEGATAAPPSGTTVDFTTSDLDIVVTAEDSTEKTWTVTATQV